MRTYLAATFLVAVAIGLAPALDLSAGGKLGGVGGSAAVRGGTGGGSAGISAGVGAAQSGIGAGKASHKSGGKSASSGLGAAASKRKGHPSPSGALRGLAAGFGSSKSSGASRIAGIAPAEGAPTSVVLPRILWPLITRPGERGEYEQGVSGYPLLDPAPTGAIPATPRAVVRVCSQAIASAASPLGAVRVRVASVGPLVPQRRGALTAPLAVRIDYAGQDGIEVRQARVRCHLDSNGRVIAVT